MQVSEASRLTPAHMVSPVLLQAAGDSLVPHLSQLSASQMKLLTIYRDRALARGS
jgi:hypothetical protein